MVVYIGGYGRSGSTIVEKYIAENWHVRSLGEVYNLQFGNSKCSCGTSVFECNLWPSNLTEYNFYQNRMYTFKSLLFESIFGLIFRKNSFSDLVSDISKFQEHFGIVSDSSKSTWRTANRYSILSRKFDTKGILLYRHPLLVYRSLLKGDNIKLRRGLENSEVFLPALRLIFGWNLTYLIKADYDVIVSFDDFTKHPDSFDFGLGKPLFGSKLLTQSHQYSGNRVARKSNVKLKPNSKEVVPQNFMEKLIWFFTRMTYRKLQKC